MNDRIKMRVLVFEGKNTFDMLIGVDILNFPIYQTLDKGTWKTIYILNLMNT